MALRSQCRGAGARLFMARENTQARHFCNNVGYDGTLLPGCRLTPGRFMRDIPAQAAHPRASLPERRLLSQMHIRLVLRTGAPAGRLAGLVNPASLAERRRSCGGYGATCTTLRTGSTAWSANASHVGRRLHSPAQKVLCCVNLTAVRSFAREPLYVSQSSAIAVRSPAMTVAVDARARVLVLVGLLISSLVLILSTGAEWPRVP